MLIAAGATGLLLHLGALRDWCHRSTELYAEIRAFPAFAWRLWSARPIAGGHSGIQTSISPGSRLSQR